ncbi:hypothetical protein [Pseudomonas sp. O230]|uniref:hypothetical protein n=1 Tax=Pseudomonas sp. O230 TaxID=3159450 RepID=UPI00387ADD39
MNKLSDTTALSLVDLTKRGLEAHLQHVVLDLIVEEQMDAFEDRLRAALKEHIERITISHVHHVKDVLKLRDEMVIQVDVNMQEVSK